MYVQGMLVPAIRSVSDVGQQLALVPVKKNLAQFCRSTILQKQFAVSTGSNLFISLKLPGLI